MSTIRANIYSNSLSRQVNITVVLPIENEKPVDGYKTLYLLNGFMGDDLDWLQDTRVKRWALENNLAVVMPAGENGFYVNDESGRRNYSQYIGEELVAITRKMFPLSTKREHTFIAGLSMGGYGAITNGLKYNQVFGKIGAFSLALVNELTMVEDSISKPKFINQIFGQDVTSIRNSDQDPRYLIENFKGSWPQIYLACGYDDFVFHCSELVHAHLEEYKVNHTYVKTEGGHEWDFWDAQIYQFIKWLNVK